MSIGMYHEYCWYKFIPKNGNNYTTYTIELSTIKALYYRPGQFVPAGQVFAITRSETEIMAPERPSILLEYYVEQDTDMLYHTHIEFDPTVKLDPKEQAYADLLIRAYNSGELENFKTSTNLKSLLLKDAKEMFDSFMAKPTKIEPSTRLQLPRSSL